MEVNLDTCTAEFNIFTSNMNAKTSSSVETAMSESMALFNNTIKQSTMDLKSLTKTVNEKIY